jgi:hypothetical protein
MAASGPGKTESNRQRDAQRYGSLLSPTHVHRISKTTARRAQMLALANSSILDRNARVGIRAS